MGPYDYEIILLHGDYADLKRIDIDSDEILLIARALLPEDSNEGTRLHYECFTYTVIQP